MIKTISAVVIIIMVLQSRVKSVAISNCSTAEAAVATITWGFQTEVVCNGGWPA